MPGVIQVSMTANITNIIDEFSKIIRSEATSPAADHIFTVRKESESTKLSKDKSIIFHHVVIE